MQRVLGETNALGRRVSRQCAGRFDLPPQPSGRDIETVRPSRYTILKEYARKERGIAQGLYHRTALTDDDGEIILPRHAVAECRAQAMSPRAFDFCNFNHHRDPRS